MSKKNDSNIYYDHHKKTDKEEIQATAWKSVFRWIYALISIFVLSSLCTMFFGTVITIDGNSMTPYLNDNEKIFVKTYNYQPKSGDVVLIGSTQANGEKLVKRIIATENQTVEIDYDAGTITVDDVVLDEPYIKKMTKPLANEISYPYVVPKNHVFVLGDNVDESIDSRAKRIQSVDVNYIVGEVVFRIYPFSQFGKI